MVKHLDGRETVGLKFELLFIGQGITWKLLQEEEPIYIELKKK